MPINQSMKVLIVDDYKTMLRIIRNLLKQIDISDVDEAVDGQQIKDAHGYGNADLKHADKIPES